MGNTLPLFLFLFTIIDTSHTQTKRTDHTDYVDREDHTNIATHLCSKSYSFNGPYKHYHISHIELPQPHTVSGDNTIHSGCGLGAFLPTSGGTAICPQKAGLAALSAITRHLRGSESVYCVKCECVIFIIFS